ncbi:SEC-C metal-binding domain-containing protein [Neorhodopirellula pilleata]|uniref:Preprotein translocase subunit SecA n=1 Tax=Neorhodopirellula pilleata TaxID=2714738 RepID=A0A5C6ADC6_9BACT|nr:SEC-C metal-binding domain-containing protein [Neorhodopirellula pilleata]TWT97440.1 hypothetical protein Pla100_25940 [Neorhodopirellula pilleata]
MTNSPIGKNSRCPCGSGKKFKHCCLRKGVTYSENEDGTIRKSVPMSDELGEHLEQLMYQRSEELGRELQPDDRLFENLLYEHVEHDLTQSMEATGVDPALIYAFQETGLIVSEENQHLISDKDLAAWQAAIDRYRSEHEPPQEDIAAFMEMMRQSNPEVWEVMKSMAEEYDDPDEFTNAIMVGPCPQCESSSTEDCECDPVIEDPCIGRCLDCRQLFCTDCRCTFEDADQAAAHECPEWERLAQLDDDDDAF